jgi:hypothetical protein
MEKDLISRFKLPTYVKGKSFADASKIINNKFEGKTDKISMDTLEEILGRLASAQEFLKEQQNPSTQPTEQMDEGGLMDTEQMGGSLNQYTGLATGLLDAGNQAFGDTGIETNGTVKYKKPNELKSIGSAAAKGAAAGMTFGPWGAAAGAVIGGVSGFLGAKKQKKEISEATMNNAFAANKALRSDFANGGSLFNKKQLDDEFSINDQSYDRLNSMDILGNYPLPVAGSVKARKPDQTKLGKQVSGTFDNIKSGVKDNFSDALRYTPIITNALQLKNMDDPDVERLDRLNNRYEKDMVDENAVVNRVQQEADNTRRAILGTTGGSLGAARSGLLGTQLNTTRALSDAMLQAENINRGENQRSQQFNLGVDQANLGQSNLENELNARNKGVYETNRSALISQIGTDIGQVGKEQRYKEMVRDMGICYDTRGRYICGTEERLPEDFVPEPTSIDNTKKDGIFNDYLEKLLKTNQNVTQG